MTIEEMLIVTMMRFADALLMISGDQLVLRHPEMTEMISDDAMKATVSEEVLMTEECGEGRRHETSFEEEGTVILTVELAVEMRTDPQCVGATWQIEIGVPETVMATDSAVDETIAMISGEHH